MKRPRHEYAKDGHTVTIMRRCYLCKVRNARFKSITGASVVQTNRHEVGSQTAPQSPILENAPASEIDVPAKATAIPAVLVNADGIAPITVPNAAPMKANRASRRCRTCGKVIRDCKDFHIVPLRPAAEGDRNSTQYLQVGAGNRPEDHCTVPPDQRDPGFPWPIGKPLPRRGL